MATTEPATGRTGQARMQELLDQLEIYETLKRGCRGFDRADMDLVRSSFHPEATISYHADFTGNAWEAFDRRTREPEYIDSVGMGDTSLNKLVGMQHHLTNHRVEVKGDQAWSECYFLGYHLTSQGDDVYLSNVGGRYIDRFERRDGEWRILSRLAVHDWDRVERIEHRWPTVQNWRPGVMGPEDPSYWPPL